MRPCSSPGDKIMGLNLAHGGHLTHGHQLNFSGKTYQVIPYSVRREDERIDYDELERIAQEHKPRMIIAGASAYPRILDFARFREIASAVGAIFLVDMAHISGLVAAGLHPNPCQYADIVTSTTHKTLRGPRSGVIFAKEQYGPAIDKTVFPGIQGGPLVHIIAAKAVCFLEALQPEFAGYQRQVVANARALAESLIAAGFRVVSGGTDTHLLLLDVFSKGVRGKEAEKALDRARITVNKNAIPFDVNPPLNPSGIRLGSPAVTTRGFGEPEMRETGALIAEVLRNIASEDAIVAVRRRVETLTERFPLYAWKDAARFSAPGPRPGGARWPRERCTSPSTRGAFAISASAPTSAAWCTRWAPSIPSTATPSSARQATSAPSLVCPKISAPRNTRAPTALRSTTRPSLCSCTAWRPTWCIFR